MSSRYSVLPLVFFTLLMTVSGCSKKKDDTPAPPVTGGGGNNTAVDHSSFTLDGQAYNYQGGHWGLGAHSNGNGSNSDLYQEAQGTIIINALTMEPPSLYYYRVHVFDQTGLWAYPTFEQLDAMFQIQSYPFGKFAGHHTGVALSELTDGVVVVYTDVNGVVWATDKGTGDQTGSSFQIVSKTAVPLQLYKANVKVAFTCKLYDGNGNMMQLTNGSMQGPAIIRL